MLAGRLPNTKFLTKKIHKLPRYETRTEKILKLHRLRNFYAMCIIKITEKRARISRRIKNMLQPQRPPRPGDLATRSPQHVRVHARQQSQKTVAASIQRLRLSKKSSVAVYNDETAPQAASEDDSPTSVAARHALSSIDATNLAPGMS